MITRTAKARYEGLGKTGKGWISTQSGVLTEQRYGFGVLIEDRDVVAVGEHCLRHGRAHAPASNYQDEHVAGL